MIKEKRKSARKLAGPAAAEFIANDGEQVFEIMDVGDVVRQGDIYITRIQSLPRGAKLVPSKAQLAPGETRGSRHCLRSLDGLQMYQVEHANVLDGPIIVAKQGCAIDHPEHGNIVLNEPGGIYAITYQRAFAEELRAVLD